MKRKNDWWAYGYLAPALLIIFAFHLLPVIYAFSLSFFEGSLNNPYKKFVGFSNYTNLVSVSNEEFWHSIFHTIYYVVGTVPLQIILALFVAVLLNQKISGVGVYRVIYFLPVITSINAVSIVWKWIYHPSGAGLLNQFLALFGIDPLAWLESPYLAMPAIIIMSIWKGLGYNVVIFLAGLQNIPRTLYEAATIDGANRWQTFVNVTWPLLSPTTYFVLIMSTISSFQVFAQVYMMTGGGPLKSTSVIVWYLYETAFMKYQMGMACAIAFVLFAIIFAMTAFQKLVVEKRVHYS